MSDKTEAIPLTLLKPKLPFHIQVFGATPLLIGTSQALSSAQRIAVGVLAAGVAPL